MTATRSYLLRQDCSSLLKKIRTKLTIFSTLRQEFGDFLVESLRLFIKHPMSAIKDGPFCQSWPLATLIQSLHCVLQTFEWETTSAASTQDKGRLVDELDSLPVIVPRVVGQQPRQPPPITQPADASEERLVACGSLGADLVTLLRGEAVAKALADKALVSRFRGVNPRALRAQHGRLVIAPEVSLGGVPVVEGRAVLQRRLIGEDKAGKVAVAKELDVRPQDGGADGAANRYDLNISVALTDGLDDRPEVSGQSGHMVAPLGPSRSPVAAHVWGDDPVLL